jgi:hypothetical protein
MANSLKGEAPLVLADKREFTLVLDFEALIEAETVYGKPLKQLTHDAGRGFMGANRALIYGALQAHHAGLSLQEAGEILRDNTLAVADALARAFDQAMPEPVPPRAGGNVSAPVASPPRGKTSGASGARPSSTRKRSGA